MRSLRTILNTPIRIPGLKPRPKVKRAPWVLRHCPEGQRRIVVLVLTFAGLIAHMVFFVAGALGIILMPLFLAVRHPEAPIAFPLRWLRAHFSAGTTLLIYAFVTLAIVGLLTYLIIVFDYLRHDASDKQKQNAP
jgi:hypothetical protein